MDSSITNRPLQSDKDLLQKKYIKKNGQFLAFASSDLLMINEKFFRSRKSKWYCSKLPENKAIAFYVVILNYF